MSKKRHVVSVRWAALSYAWTITASGVVEESVATKAHAVRLGVFWAKEMQPSELYIHTKNGRIGERRTYKGDPERRKG